MPSLDEIVGHATTTGLVPAQRPSYDDWLSQIAQGYVSTHGSDMLGLADNSTNQESLDRMTQTLRDNKGLRNIYNQGVTPEQIFNAPLMNSGSFDAGGFGVFGGKPYEQLTDAQKALVDKGAYQWEYNPTLTGTNGSENGGYYWASTDKTPKVLGKYGTGSFTEFNPFNASQWNDTGKIAFDPNYGLVTLANNRNENGFDSALYNIAPMAAIAIMTMGAGISGLASTMMKVPGIAQSIGNGGNPFSSILGLAAGAAGVPGGSLFTSLLSTAMNRPGGGGSSGGNNTSTANPFGAIMALALLSRLRGGQGGGG